MKCETKKCKNTATHAKENWDKSTDPGFKFNYFCVECYKTK